MRFFSCAENYPVDTTEAIEIKSPKSIVGWISCCTFNNLNDINANGSGPNDAYDQTVARPASNGNVWHEPVEDLMPRHGLFLERLLPLGHTLAVSRWRTGIPI